MNETFVLLLEKLQKSKKYAGICPDTLERVLQECLLRHKKPKDAEKAAREKLHGITGAFMTPEQRRNAQAALLPALTDENALTELMRQHASTRERLPLSNMDALYDRLFSTVGKPERILDLACGLNPLYLGIRGYAVTGIDIQNDAVELINRLGAQGGMPVCAHCADLLLEHSIPEERFSLALALKLLPLLEREQSGAAERLLQRVRADRIAVSFPTRTLTGRNVGMEANYTRWMEERLPSNLRVLDRFVQGDELFYLLAPVE